ncbi:gluconate 2-dehydrogenase subunit 3 family protein [Oleiagrimonas sp.]|jgi:hypothetical protein|uniref:gluconate 2-dehydrogenase subunit 3 family protein n=1 Tax=Oleiagrimonas sp. TaxID=2010330 RepID=UPI00261FED0D|nr:gluconate 2-dehydrogenase subunit 3 family protein [Oleiagrimonas sp.]MDA3914204.1 gluconate 2-dehydrogenase subunit 3 family protein [Oleiagrimonas sp.]
MTSTTKTRYPGYDVLNKRGSPSWDAVTRKVVDDRMATPVKPRFLDSDQWRTALALCAAIVAQPDDRPAVPVAALLDRKLHEDSGDGYRNARLPRLRDAWRIGLAALDTESQNAHGDDFAALSPTQQNMLLQRMQEGQMHEDAWQDMPPELFFSDRVLADLYGAYYSHPSAWSEIGFGGPANPRGYVRMVADRRDPWEAIEATSADDEEHVRQANAHVR